MGRWSSSQLRGGGGTAANATSVQLFADEGTGIFWDYQGTQPVKWRIESSNDPDNPDGPWFFITTVAGSTLAFNGTTDQFWYRVMPANNAGDPVGAPSNSVQYTD